MMDETRTVCRDIPVDCTIYAWFVFPVNTFSGAVRHSHKKFHRVKYVEQTFLIGNRTEELCAFFFIPAGVRTKRENTTDNDTTKILY